MFQSNIYNNDQNFDRNLFLSTNEEKLSSKNMTSNKNKNVSNNNKFIKIKKKKKKEINIKKPNIEEIINKRIFKNKENNSKQNNDKTFHCLNRIENKSNIIEYFYIKNNFILMIKNICVINSLNYIIIQKIVILNQILNQIKIVKKLKLKKMILKITILIIILLIIYPQLQKK